MTTRPAANTLEPLVRAVVTATTGASATDAELLTQFIDCRDEAAFAALVRRHGPMVLGVCRRLLPNEVDAEDVFQASFLVLALKAASVTPRETVAAWLHGVARQVALRARRSNARRAARERQVDALPEPESVPRDDHWDDLLPVLDRELSRLPDRYRTILVLCDLEGVTRQEAGRQLGLPEGTVNSRLSRARAMLTNRLTRCGVALPSAALAAVLARNASACVPASVMGSTIRVAVLAAEAGTAATGGVSAGVLHLTEGVARAMFVTKLKAVVAVVLLLGFLAAGATALTGRSASARGDQPPATEPKGKASPRPEPELDLPGARPNLAGTWQGDDWGTVVLRPAKDGGYEGTYSSTFGKDTGRIAVRWSAASRRYEGTWSEGTYRFGRIALDAPKDGAISGAYTTDPKSEHQPGVPSLASLRWTKKKDEEKPVPARPTPQPAKTDRERMVGNWFITNEDSLRKGEMWVITEDSILMHAKNLGLNIHHHAHRLDAGKSPKQIDITVTKGNRESVGVIKGIYALDGDELRLCLGEMGKDRPAAFPDKPKPGEVLILQRERWGTTPPAAKDAKTEQKALTPEEAIKQMPKENVTVQFKVAKVEAFPNPGTGFGGPTYYIYLGDGGKFTARMAKSADQFMKLGVEPVKHFAGKVVRVTGRVEPDSGKPSFQMWVRDLADIEVVKE